MSQTKTERENKKYLEAFFDEKEIPYTAFNLYDETGSFHYIDTDVVIEFIKNYKDTSEIVTTLRYLDFHNLPVVPFLKFCAEVIINSVGE